MSRLVGTATGYGLDDRRVEVPSPGKVRKFHFPIRSRPALGSFLPPTRRIPGVLYLGVKQQERETGSSPTSADVKKT
jgi:hypothetical protein